MGVIRILIVDEIKLMGDVTASALRDEEDFDVAGVVTTVEEALAKVEHVDVILVSADLPDQGAATLTREMTSGDVPVKIIIMGISKIYDLLLDYIQLGASGYVLRDDSMVELIKNIRAASNDKALVSPEIAAGLVQRVQQLSQSQPQVDFDFDQIDLTPREQEVLKLVAEGMTNQEIGDRLFIELGTVKNHVHSILNKLNVSNRDEAALYLKHVRSSES